MPGSGARSGGTRRRGGGDPRDAAQLAIGLAEQHAREPRAPQATGEQQAAIRAQLLAQALPGCATLARASWACAMAASDRAAMMVCETAGNAAP